MPSNRSAPRRFRPVLEELEPRQMLSGYSPTAAEQLFLEELNDARANPAAYGASIGLDLSGVAPSQPLAFNPLLIQAARDHSTDMAVQGYFGHNTPAGVDPGAQMSNDGFNWTSWGQSIAGGSAYPQPSDALAALIIDNGVPDLGHRIQLLAMNSMFQGQNQAGVGITQGGPLSNYYSIDSATGTDTRPFITGVVYNDSNGNGKYDSGEGIGGAIVTISGVGSVATWSTGGYSAQVNPGTYTVTVSGGGLASPVSRTVTVGAWNSRQNFTAPPAPAVDPAIASAHGPGFITNLYAQDLGRTPSASELSYWQGVLQTNGSAGVANPIAHSSEALNRIVVSYYQTYLGRTPGSDEAGWWVNAMVNGATEEQVAASMMGSAEYFTRAGASNTAFLQSLYSSVLHRTASAAEVNYWLGEMNTMGRANVAGSFFTSNEYRAEQTQADYQNILRRTASGAEISYWVNCGLDLLRVEMSLEGSQEALTNS